MVLKISLFLFCCSLILVSFGCGPRSDQTSPEMSRNMLKLRGYQFNKKEFFRGIRMEDGKVVRAFLQGGMDPDAKNEKGETALVFAIREKDPRIAKLLIEKADINKQDDRGNSPLHMAIRQDKTWIVKLLLEKGADVNVTGTYKKVKNQTPLYQAIIRGDLELAAKLLEKKADPNITDSKGAFALAEAVIRPDANPKFVELLIKSGADVNKQESNGSTALLYAASNKAITPEIRQQIVQILLDNKADKSIKNKKGQDALYWAKEFNHEKVVEMLQ